MGGTGYLERLPVWEGHAEPRTVQGVTAADTAGFGIERIEYTEFCRRRVTGVLGLMTF